MKKTIYIVITIFTLCITGRIYASTETSSKSIEKKSASLDTGENVKSEVLFPVKFREVWGYLMRGEEKVFRGDEPVTDVCYFSCGVNSEGKININVTPPELPFINGNKRRIHMVITDYPNSKVMHKILDPGNALRDQMVKDIIEVSKKFDGVQIDFEAIGEKDSAVFLEFLKMIKAGLEPGKIFSIALPPKTVKVEDAYDYKSISEVVDKVFIMAYDQHWSTSKPGPVASLSWCRDIMVYSKSIIPSDKLIMGIPLYGRSWKDMKIVTKIYPNKKKNARNSKKHSKSKKAKPVIITRHVVKSRSVKSSHISDLLASKHSVKEYSTDTGFKIMYKGSDKEILFCDDVNATMEKFLYYRDFVDSIGFWRLGMENREMWGEIMLQAD